MSNSFKFDMSGLKKLIERMDSPTIKEKLMEIPQSRAIAALISQAISDNFDKEGPGWAPLKGATIRQSVSKKMRARLSGMTNEDIETVEAKARKKGDTPIRKILQRTGLLKRTATTPFASVISKDGKVAGSNIYKVEGTNIIWGSTLSYAAIHNRGDAKKNIPKREFLVIRSEWMNKINDYVVKKVLDIIKHELRLERNR